jgi:hypothetical protein
MQFTSVEVLWTEELQTTNSKWKRIQWTMPVQGKMGMTARPALTPIPTCPIMSL